MKVTEDLKNLFDYLSASHLLKEATDIYSFVLQMPAFKIFLHYVKVCGWLKNFINMGDANIAALHDTNLR